MYRSPNAPPESIHSLENLFKAVKKNSVLIGDFNLPDIEWREGTGSAGSRALIEAADEALLEQIVDFPTHIRGYCLDLILTNMPERFYNVTEAGRLGKSDHEMIFSSIVMDAELADTAKNVTNWRKADWSNMRADLAGVDWKKDFEDKTAYEMWSEFKAKIEASVKKNVPEKKQRSCKRPAWMNKDIKAAINKKKRLWNRAKQGSGMD